MKILGILNLRIVLFLSILILAAIIRFGHISTLPVSLYWDEVSEGYNSYSILETGKDEWGSSFPILFRGYDDYKMPVYIYLSVIPIALFGLNEFSVRFISAFLGVGSVVVCFFLVREILKKERLRDAASFLSMFFLSITPWHIQLSRAGFEANAALFFVMSGFLFMLKSLDKRWYLIPSSVLFGVSLYTYRSSLIVVPFLITAVAIFYRKELFQKVGLKVLLLALVIIILLSLPIYSLLVTQGDTRSDEVSIFSSSTDLLQDSSHKLEAAGNSLAARVIYNRRLVYAEEIGKNYLSHFTPNFLFLRGDTNPRHSVGSMGILYLWQAPFILLGIVFLLRKYKKQAGILLVWLLLSPLPASLSYPAPHALRSLLMLPPLIIFTGIGVYYLYLLLEKRLRIAYVILLISVVLGSSIIYARVYIEHNSKIAAADWGDGYKELVETIKPQLKDFDRVIISGHYWQPYMYTLFYTQYDPMLYQKFGSQEKFGKFIFGGTAWDQRLGREELGHVDLEKLAGSKKTLVALSPGEYDSQLGKVRKISEIKDHQGRIVFVLGRILE